MSDGRDIPDVSLEMLQKSVIVGDLSDLNDQERAEYYYKVCRSLGLNPLTRPFDYLTLNGKMRLYPLRDCADQLRRIHGISIYITNREHLRDLYIVTARAKDKTGREDESTGAVAIGQHLKGDALANAIMKAETKAKRRVTLSIAGLGWLDETELDTIPPQTIAPTAAIETPVARIKFDNEGLELPPEEPGITQEEFDRLKAHADNAVGQATDLRHMTIRRVMNAPGEQFMSEKYILKHMTKAQYQQAWNEFEDMNKRKEVDTPEFPSPNPPAAEPEGTIETVEFQGEPVEVEISALKPPHAAENNDGSEGKGQEPPVDERAAERPAEPLDGNLYAHGSEIAALRQTAKQVDTLAGNNKGSQGLSEALAHEGNYVDGKLKRPVYDRMKASLEGQRKQLKAQAPA